jgi:hypothetical protein
MNPVIALNLSLLLLLPWYLVLGIVYWRTRRKPANGAQRAFDAASLCVAVLAAAAAGWWSMHNADPAAGAIWKQVLASLAGYGAFLAVLAAAFWLRRARTPARV